MARTKKKPPAADEIQNAKAAERKAAGFLPDGDGGSLAPLEIAEITDAAEAYRVKKEERQLLKEQEDELYEKLKDAMTDNLAKLGPSRKYQYLDGNDVRREVSFGEPGITVRKVKKVKGGDPGDGMGIVSDPDLEDDLDNDAE